MLYNIIRPVVTPQIHILPEMKNISHVKPRIGQGGAEAKRRRRGKHFDFLFSNHMITPNNQNLPGGKTTIQIADMPIL